VSYVRLNADDGAHYKLPYVISWPSRAGLDSRQEERGIFADFRRELPSRSRLLAMGSWVVADAMEVEVDRPLAVKGTSDLRRRMGFEDAGFREPVSEAAVYGINVSASLRKCGFSAPADLADRLGPQSGAWYVVVYVEAGEDGSIDHVFVERGCPDAARNLAVARVLSLARTSGGRRCSGRVTVGYGPP
jgi:hypothetical protein